MIPFALLWLGVATSTTAQLRLRAPEPGLSLGAFGGVFIPSDSHELYNPLLDHRRFRSPAAELGLRATHLPWSWAGFEVEAGLLPATLVGGGDATLYTFRGHLVFRYPGPVTPFVVVGGGVLGVESSSVELGDDLDPELHWGIGASLHWTKLLELRADLRQIITASRDPPGSGDGSLTSHFELLVGFGFRVLGSDGGKDDRLE